MSGEWRIGRSSAERVDRDASESEPHAARSAATSLHCVDDRWCCRRRDSPGRVRAVQTCSLRAGSNSQ
eukprot:4319867-Prymnesium_polylepis.1